MTDICKVLKRQPSFSCHGGVSDEAIDDAEKRLGIHFAEEYRTYLSALGAADYYGHELTGLNCPRYLDVVSSTFEGREIYPDVPSDYYVIEEARIDGVTYWQDATGAVYEVVPNGVPKRRYSKLAEYVEGTAMDD